MLEQHVEEELPEEFLIILISTLLNGRHVTRAPVFRGYAITNWSAIGTALVVALKWATAPGKWTSEMTQCWFRAYGALLREVLRRGNIADTFSLTPTARIIPGRLN